jgi:hypothetical protein
MKQKMKYLVASTSAGFATLIAGATQVLAQTTPTNTKGNGAPGAISTGPGYATDIANVISFALNLVMVVALLLVFLYLILGGIQWITSGGDKGKTEEARNKITAAVNGIIILAVSYALVQFVAYILGLGSFSSIFSTVQQLNTTK